MITQEEYNKLVEPLKDKLDALEAIRRHWPSLYNDATREINTDAHALRDRLITEARDETNHKSLRAQFFQALGEFAYGRIDDRNIPISDVAPLCGLSWQIDYYNKEQEKDKPKLAKVVVKSRIGTEVVGRIESRSLTI